MMLLSNLAPAEAKRVDVELRAEMLRVAATQLEDLKERPNGTLSRNEAHTLRAACRGLARCAATHGENAQRDGIRTVDTLQGVAKLITQVNDLTDELLARGAGFIPPTTTAPTAADATAASAFLSSAACCDDRTLSKSSQA